MKQSGRGDLVIGRLAGSPMQPQDLGRVAELFARVGVSCRVAENIEGELWTKMAFNCAGNAVTALGRSSYARAIQDPAVREVIRAAAAEAIAVARAAGVRMPETDLGEAGLKLAKSLGDATSSTAQNIARGKQTEIGSLNGHIARRSRELSVPVPVNTTRYALVKLVEKNG